MSQTKQDMLELFDGNKTFCAANLGVSQQWIERLPNGVLSEQMLRRVRDWFLREKGRVPADWMPERKS